MGGKGYKMTYKDYTKKKGAEYSALPIFWAFSEKQLAEALEKRGFTLADAGRVLYRFGNGGFYLKADADVIKEFFSRDHNAELHALMENEPGFAAEAIEYEMLNHEYPINWEGDYDVCSCFGACEYGDSKYGADYLREMGYTEKIVTIYKATARKVRSEHEW